MQNKEYPTNIYSELTTRTISPINNQNNYQQTLELKRDLSEILDSSKKNKHALLINKENILSTSPTKNINANHQNSDQSKQVLLALVEKNQQLAQESDQRLIEKEKEYQELLEQGRLRYEEQIYKLKAEIKVLKSSDEIQNKSGNKNKMIDKIRSLLVEEIERLDHISQEKEKKLKNDIQDQKCKLISYEKVIQDLNKDLSECKAKIKYQEESTFKQEQQFQLQIIDLKRNCENEIQKYQLQCHALNKNNLSKNETEKQIHSEKLEKTSQYQDLLIEFQDYKIATDKQCEIVEEIQYQLQQERREIENYCYEKCKLQEMKSVRLETEIQQIQNTFEQMKFTLESQINDLDNLRNEERNKYSSREQEVQINISRISKQAIEQIISSQNIVQDIVKQVQESVNKFVNSISLDNKPKLQTHEKLIQSFQKENAMLRQQVDLLVKQSNQIEEKQSIVKLRSSLFAQINRLIDLIGNQNNEREQQDKNIQELEQKLEQLDIAHSQKEFENCQTINLLSEELQQCKFNLRKFENNDLNKENKTLKDQVKLLEFENVTLKSNLVQQIESLKKLEKELVMKLNKPSQSQFDLLQLKEIEIERLNSENGTLLSTKQDLEDFYIQKVETLGKELVEKQEKFDEILIKYTRLLQRTKTSEAEQIQVWTQRQSVFNDQIKFQRKQINELKNLEEYKKGIEKLADLSKQSKIQLNEIQKRYQNEIEHDYQKKIDILTKDLDIMNNQKNQLMKLIQEYESHYSDITNERENQVTLLKDLSDKFNQLYSERNNDQCQIAKSIKDIQNILLKEEEGIRKNIKVIISTVIQEKDQLKQQLQQAQQCQCDTKIKSLIQKIEEQQQEFCLLDTQKKLLEQKINTLEIQYSQQNIAILKEKEVLDKLFSRINNNIEPIQSIKNIDKLMEKLNQVKKPAEINQILRDVKLIISENIIEIKCDKKYTKFIRNQREERLINEINILKRQRDSLMLKLSVNNEQDEIKILLKDIQKLEQERLQKIENENERLLKILSQGSKDKLKDLKSMLTKSRKSSPDKSMFYATMTNITQTFSPRLTNSTITTTKQNTVHLSDSQKKLVSRQEWK